MVVICTQGKRGIGEVVLTNRKQIGGQILLHTHYSLVRKISEITHPSDENELVPGADEDIG